MPYQAKRQQRLSAANKNTIKNTVLSVALDSDIKTNLTNVQSLITEAPGNKGGAELIVRYYNEQF